MKNMKKYVTILVIVSILISLFAVGVAADGKKHDSFGKPDNDWSDKGPGCDSDDKGDKPDEDRDDDCDFDDDCGGDDSCDDVLSDDGCYDSWHDFWEAVGCGEDEGIIDGITGVWHVFRAENGKWYCHFLSDYALGQWLGFGKKDWCPICTDEPTGELPEDGEIGEGEVPNEPSTTEPDTTPDTEPDTTPVESEKDEAEKEDDKDSEEGLGDVDTGDNFASVMMVLVGVSAMAVVGVLLTGKKRTN